MGHALLDALTLIRDRGFTLSRSESGRLKISPPELTQEEVDAWRPIADCLHALVLLRPMTPVLAADLLRVFGDEDPVSAVEAFCRVVRAFASPHLPGAVLRDVEMPPPKPKRG